MDDEELRQNFDAIRQERGWSWDTLTTHLEQIDASKSLVEWARGNVKPETKAARGSAKRESAVTGPVEKRG